jgi:NAD(P)-dependent dehydrogenase (short-subunit alcohol dehydrogenase family)
MATQEDTMRTTRDNESRGTKVWLVTGASRGFGRAICRAALNRGDSVIATAPDREALDGFAEAGSRALALSLDVTDSASVETAVRDGIGRFGRLDVVVNNAGYGHFGAIEELSEEEMRDQYEVNLFGVLRVTRAALPQLRRQRSGHVIQMSSLNGVVGMMGGGHYAASKFAVEGFSESLAEEVAPLGIRVTIVEPGPHRTGFAGAGARLARPIEDYAPTVGAAREAFADLDGNQPGDPAEAAEEIVECAHAADPPLRLALGEIAVNGIRERLTARLTELEAAAGA